jgi:hypothetical protein
VLFDVETLLLIFFTNTMNKRTISLVLILGLALEMFAQCPMCRMSAESNMQNGGTAGAGLNAGILYMLVAPYLIVGGLAFWWWKNRKKEDEQEPEWLRPDAEEAGKWN